MLARRVEIRRRKCVGKNDFRGERERIWRCAIVIKSRVFGRVIVGVGIYKGKVASGGLWLAESECGRRRCGRSGSE